MKKRMKKIRRHARRRFDQRFGIKLHSALKQNIINMIQTGKAKAIKKQSNRISLFKVNVENSVIVVVYDRSRKEIVTGWPCRKGA